ncbi:Oxidase ustYa [Psilocybe cubensis]|uniref:Oxidase ustYa n=2 Tax=Psilocybe cubensis TaxID=181762 RepID=A0ACB8GMJ0_PSICU|nr:Oxidase ustYa [Psilocybe cubensis]KAH9476612.1 Oxidase ustYa [Psilocybe cubensis]
MTSHAMKHTVKVPLLLVISASVALIISLSVHLLSISLNVGAIFKPVSKTEAVLPIQIQPATLTISKAERFGLYSNESEWESILPMGDGFIYHPDDQKHYLVSHFHSLHCLRSFHRYLRMAMVSNPQNDGYTMLDIGHVHHCLIYLRQILLCNADLTLEPASHKQRTPDGKIVETVTGIDIAHRCTDWEQLWEYMGSNYEQYKDTYDN